MKSVVRLIRIAGFLMLGFIVPAFASCDGSVSKGPLDNLSIDAPQKKIELRLGELVSLYQNEAFDPFNLFQEGMDPANENGLDVTNEPDGLVVSLGGFRFKSGKDGSCTFRIEALEYSGAAQRYVVHCDTTERQDYKVLVNVDPKISRAKVWMKQMKPETGWSDWQETALYSSVKSSAREDESVDSPMDKLPVIAGEDLYIGLNCKNHNGGRQLFKIIREEGKLSFRLYYEIFELSPVVGTIPMNELFRKIIATGKLDLAAGLRVVNTLKKTDMTFEADGKDEKGRPLLKINGLLQGKKLFLTDCRSRVEDKAHIW